MLTLTPGGLSLKLITNTILIKKHYIYHLLNPQTNSGSDVEGLIVGLIKGLVYSKFIIIYSPSCYFLSFFCGKKKASAERQN